MKINIQSIDFTVRQQLNEFVQRKVQKFKKLCGDIISIDVKFKLDKAADQVNKVCGIRLVIPGYDMLSNTKSNSFEDAVSMAVEALERQIEKRKKKIRKQMLTQNGYALQLALPVQSNIIDKF